MESASLAGKIGDSSAGGNLPVAEVPGQLEYAFALRPCLEEGGDVLDPRKRHPLRVRQRGELDELGRQPSKVRIVCLCEPDDLGFRHRAVEYAVQIVQDHAAPDRT